MLEIVIIAFLSGLTTFIGVWLATLIKEKKRLVCVGIGFSSGIMIAIGFLELFPMALEKMGEFAVLGAFAAGFMLVWVFDFFLPHMHFVREAGEWDPLLKTSYLVAFGIIIHDFPEGFAMASGYAAQPAIGLLIAMGIALHNIPEEFALSVPLILANKKKTVLWIALLSALAEPAGALVGVLFVSWVPALSPIFMAFAAGAMIFVAIDELLPLAQKYGNLNYASLGLVLGMVVYMMLSFTVQA